MPNRRDAQLKPYQQAQEELKNSNERFRTVMDSLDALVYVSDMDTHEILFTNKYGRNIWGDIVGKTCWKTLQSGRTGPCEFCTNDKLLDSNGEPTGVYRWEFQNTVDNQWYDCHDQAIRWTDGRLVRIEIATDITERKKAEETVRNIAEGISAATGDTFFCLLVQYLARILEADYAFVGELMEGQKERIRTLAMCANGEIVDNFEYDLTDTPCENVVGQKMCTYPRDVQAQFPHDHMLAEMGIESYVGIPLFDSGGNPIGLAVILNSKPLSNPELAESMLKIFAVRASAELQRKRAEEALRESEEKYRRVVEDQTEFIVRWLPDGIRTFVNDSYCRYFGKTRDELIGSSFFPLITEEDRGKVRKRIESLSLENPVSTDEHQVIRPDGSIGWNQWTDRAIFDERGQLIEFQSIGRDITERQNAEEALRISEEKLSKAFRSSPDIMGILDLKNRRRIEVGGGSSRVTGYSLEEITGTTLEELDIFIDKAKVEELLRVLDKEGFFREIEIRIRTKTGQERTILYSGEAFEIKEEKYAIIVGHDITDRKHAESSLRESKEALRVERDKLKALMDGINRAGIGVDVVGADYKILFQNKILGEECGDPCGKCCYEYYMAREEPCDQCPAMEAIKEKKAVSAEQWSDGRYYQVFSAPLPDADGTVSKAIEIVLDITERRRAENALRFTQFSVDHSADAAFWMGPNAKLFYVNEMACRSLGYSREELLTMSVHDIDPNFPVEAWPAHWSEVKERGSFTIESHHRAKNGLVFPVEVSVNYVVFEGKEYNCAFAKDISERKQSENALRQHNEFLGCVMESLTHPFLVINTDDYTIDMANSAAWKGELAEGMMCYEVSHHRDHPCDDIEHPCPLKHIKKTGLPITVEHIHYDPLGNARNVEVHGYPLFDDQGNITKMIEYCLDVTKRKQVEIALEENEKQFRATFEQAAVGVAHVAPDGRFIRVNQRFCDIAGYTQDEMLERTFQDITHPDDLEADLDYVRQMLADEISTYSMEKRYIRKDGSSIWINLTVSLLRENSGEPKFFISVIEDITERKRLEEAYHGLVDNSIQGLGIIQDGRTVFTNKALASITGYSKEDMLAASPEQFRELVHPEDRKLVWARHRDRLAGKPTPPRYEFRGIRKDGSTHWVEIYASRIEYQGRPAIQAAYVDITDRKRAEEALKKSREEFQRQIEFLNHVLESMTHPFLVIDANDYTVKLANSAARIALLSDKTTRYFPSQQLYGPSDEPNCICPIKIDQATTVEHIHYDKNGNPQYIEVHSYPIWDDRGNITDIIEYCLDISKRKRAEKKILDYQERLRFLASELSLAEERQRRRIATELHDNTSQELAFALTKLQNIRETASGDSLELLSDICEMMNNVVENVRNMTFDICSPTLYRFDLETAVSELLEDKLGSRDEVSYSFCDDEKTKTLSEDVKVVLFQSVRELVNNIIKHALANNVAVDIRRCKDTIRITVSDDGIGFKGEKLESSEQSRSGFGLFSIAERLKYIGGSFEFQSQPGQGCSFTLEAPLEDDAK
jgi:PAS domain S-box-containing protein